MLIRVWLTWMMGLGVVIGISLSAQAQAVGGGGSGGGGLKMNFAPSGSPGCVEGRRGSMTVVDPDNPDYTRIESRVCRNGTYMTDEERAAYIYKPRNRCREGSIEGWNHIVGSSDRHEMHVMVCRRGRWVRLR